MPENKAAATAFGPMVLSAIEHNEPPERRLVDDPLARRFLPARLRAVVDATRARLLRDTMIGASERSGPGLWAGIACRKRYIDDNLAAAMGSTDAVVVLGAGLDTRAYRLAQHSTAPVFEVDLPVNIARKHDIVDHALGGVPSSVQLVAVDFETESFAQALTAHGYRRDARTFVIWEGVTQYLTADAVDATFAQLRECAPGSRIDFTYIRSDFIDGTNHYGARSVYRRFVGRRHPLWLSGLDPAHVSDYLAEYGWRLVEDAGPDEFMRRYVQPTGRTITTSPIERSVLAERG